MSKAIRKFKGKARKTPPYNRDAWPATQPPVYEDGPPTWMDYHQQVEWHDRRAAELEAKGVKYIVAGCSPPVVNRGFKK